MSGTIEPSEVMFTSAKDLRETLSGDPTVVLIVGARVRHTDGKTDLYIVFQEDLLESLSLRDKALLVESFQRAAEYVFSRIQTPN